jgi:hypothetical protein
MRLEILLGISKASFSYMAEMARSVNATAMGMTLFLQEDNSYSEDIFFNLKYGKDFTK